MSIVRSRPLYLLFVVAGAACGTLTAADDTAPSVSADAGVDANDDSPPPPPGDDTDGGPPIVIEGGADVVTSAGHRYAFVSAGTGYGHETVNLLNALCTSDAAKVAAFSGRKFVAFVSGATVNAGAPWYLPGDAKRVFDGTVAPTPSSGNLIPEVAINVDVTGNPIRFAQVLVWTGSQGGNCGGWTNKAGTNADIADANDRLHWLYLNSTSICAVQHHVYCFEE
jgi:hypothetical protein